MRDRSAVTVDSESDTVRVLFVNTATLPPLGADTWVHGQIIANLDQSSHEVHVACAGDRSAPTPTYRMMSEIPGVRLLRTNFGPELAHLSPAGKIKALLATVPAAAHIARLAMYVRRHRITIIHTSDRPRDAAACILLARLTGARCIVHVHVGFDAGWMSALLRWSLQRADALVAISEFVARSLESGGHPARRIHVVLNAIDHTAWEPRRGREEGRAEFGIAESAVVLITVCRLFPEKGPGELLRALALVRRECPDVHLLVVGHEMTPGYANELSNLADALGVSEQVVFTGRRSDVARLMAASDVFAMPSFEEPFGLVYLEAMAMELPVVALANGGTPEVVEHGRTGLLSPAGDTEALAANLLTLIRDPATRARMGGLGRQSVQAHFSAARMARDTARVYRLLA